jgi:hypothetical protein
MKITLNTGLDTQRNIQRYKPHCCSPKTFVLDMQIGSTVCLTNSQSLSYIMHR